MTVKLIRHALGIIGIVILLGCSTAQSDVSIVVPTSNTATKLLLLVPGYNGSSEAMLDERWKTFAEKHGLVLLALTFKTTPEELQRGRGYYYPEQGSGAEVERMLEQVGKETGVQTDKILIFGFSAGAHFAHRFALWKPERVDRGTAACESDGILVLQAGQEVLVPNTTQKANNSPDVVAIGSSGPSDAGSPDGRNVLFIPPTIRDLSL
jgi:pimeloyl-ACP methyl ester carboxylesterase